MEVYIKKEVSDEKAAEKDDVLGCCLCNEGHQIQREIISHLKAKHETKFFEKNYSIDSCSCPEGLKLQIRLVNHLLSHVPKEKDEDNRLEIPDTLHERYFESDEDSSSDDWDDDDFPHPQFTKELEPATMLNLVLNDYVATTTIPPAPAFKCSMCPVVRVTTHGLEGHKIREHDPTSAFACTMDTSICKARFKTASLLQHHLKYHYIGFNNCSELNCTVCHQTYKTRESLMKHVSRHIVANEVMSREPEKIEYYECDQCDKKWPIHQKFNLQQHIKKVHMKSQTMRPYRERKSRNDTTGKVICYICSKYITPSSLKAHIFNMHEKKSKYVCDFEGCGSCFMHPSGLAKHKDYHLGIKRLSCEYCAKKFFEAGNLRQHLLRHTDPDMFKCDTCEKRFVNTRSLILHKRSHEDDDGRKPFACDQCERAYKYKESLKSHVKEAHSNQPRLTCKRCPFSGTKDGIRQHESRVHKIKKRKKYVFDN